MLFVSFFQEDIQTVLKHTESLLALRCQFRVVCFFFSRRHPNRVKALLKLNFWLLFRICLHLVIRMEKVLT